MNEEENENPGFIACTLGISGFIVAVLFFAALLGAVGFAAVVVAAVIFGLGFILFFLYEFLASILKAIFD